MKLYAATFSAFAVLTACADVDPISDPNQFGFIVLDGDIEGAFNPQGFTTSEVQTQIARGCLTSPEIIDYVETPVGNGLIEFKAECRTSKLIGDSYDYVVERTSNGFNLTSTTLITFP